MNVPILKFTVLYKIISKIEIALEFLTKLNY